MKPCSHQDHHHHQQQQNNNNNNNNNNKNNNKNKKKKKQKSPEANASQKPAFLYGSLSFFDILNSQQGQQYQKPTEANRAKKPTEAKKPREPRIQQPTEAKKPTEAGKKIQKNEKKKHPLYTVLYFGNPSSEKMVLLPKSPGVFVGINVNERDAIWGAHMS